jgi:imidazolonepropionase-like amidohydrolase
MDMTGKVVMPGLIDMHYHVTTGAMRYRRDAAGHLDTRAGSRFAGDGDPRRAHRAPG